jgi:hypothetical protein
MGWMTEGSDFDSKFLLLFFVKTVSGVHPVDYPMGTGHFFPGDETARS